MYTIPVFTIADLPAKRRHFWVDWSSELPQGIVLACWV